MYLLQVQYGDEIGYLIWLNRKESGLNHSEKRVSLEEMKDGPNERTRMPIRTPNAQISFLL